MTIWIANHFDVFGNHVKGYEINQDVKQDAIRQVYDSTDFEWKNKGTAHAIGYNEAGDSVVVHRMSRFNSRLQGQNTKIDRLGK